MPWQIAPALVIISGAFTVTGGLLAGIQYAAFGRVSYIIEHHQRQERAFTRFSMPQQPGLRLFCV